MLWSSKKDWFSTEQTWFFNNLKYLWRHCDVIFSSIMLKIDIQICFTTIPPMQNFIEILQRNPELLSSGGFRPPRLDRGIERPRLDRVKIGRWGDCLQNRESPCQNGRVDSSGVFWNPPPFLLYLWSSYNETWHDGTLGQNLSKAIKTFLTSSPGGK